MEWSMTNNVHKERVAFMQPPQLEFNSSNWLHCFNCDPYAGYSAGNPHTHAATQTELVSSVPESGKIINAHQCPSNNNSEIMIKKKRLTSEQLASLELSFQESIKLDSDRKLKLSKELGLQPRQTAVWFQNRRARWKVKHLEESYDSLRQEYDTVWREKQMLHDEVKKLRAIMLRDQSLINRNHIAGGSQTNGNGEHNSPKMVASSRWPPMSQPPYPW